MTNEKKLAAIMNVIKPYLEHEDGCNQTPYKQERFKEWIDALNDTPEKYRDEGWHDDYAKYNATHGICTCKHEKLKFELAPYCMELTDEEIKEYAHSTVGGVCSDLYQSVNVSGFITGAKFYRDRGK